MKKALLNILKILIFIAASIYLFVHISYANRDALAHTRKNMAGFYDEKNNTIDLAIIGTSSTFSAYMPMELWKEYGITGYDVCTNLMYEEAMPYAIRELSKTQSPKLVVIDLSPFILGDNIGVSGQRDLLPRANIDAYRYSLNRIDMINALIPNSDERWSYYFDISYYHRNGELDLQYWNFSKHNSNKGYNNLAYVYDDEGTSQFSARSEQFSLPEHEIENLDTLLSEASNHDFECLFTILPYYESTESSERNNRAQFLNSYVSERGFCVLNMFNSKNEMGIGEASDYSSDGLHFHALSAKRITDYFGSYLNANYSLPDHRGDDKYSSWRDSETEWDENLGMYQKQIEELDRRNK